MPYSKTSDLPDGVKGALPEHARKIFMHAYNNAHGRMMNEENCNKRAWGAVKASYHKDKSGNWVKNTS